jgi:hypothetical protein
VPHLVDWGITHMQYADDIVLLIQNEEVSIVNLKLILYCFESMSVMKIIYHKSSKILPLFIIHINVDSPPYYITHSIPMDPIICLLKI